MKGKSTKGSKFYCILRALGFAGFSGLFGSFGFSGFGG